MIAIWDWFKDVIFIALNALQGVLGDWGLAIIVITLIFRIILIPLTAKQTKSAAQMQKVQPKMQELQNKYRDQPEVLQEKMSEFYKENKINPLGGCLLPLLQMPIFIALYQVLRTLPLRIYFDGSLPLGEALASLSSKDPISFFNIIPNLSVSLQTLMKWSAADGGFGAHWLEMLPYVVIVLLTGISTILPQLLQKNTNNAQASSMRTMSLVMGAMMLYIGWISPAGVLLYWVTSSVFGVVQQLLIQKKIYAQDEEEEAITVEPVSVKAKSKKPTKKGSK